MFSIYIFLLHANESVTRQTIKTGNQPLKPEITTAADDIFFYILYIYLFFRENMSWYFI